MTIASLATRTVLSTLVLVAVCGDTVLAQQKGRKAEKPAPDLTAKYGPHERNVLDLWKAKSDTPTSLVAFILCGGFHARSKESLAPALLEGLLEKGISVMAINYRLSPEVSFPAHYMDCARAIQFARSKAKEWNLDSQRVGATGGSAGAGTSLWIGFHDDLADPKNADPVLRESTRLKCMAVQGAQSSYDPRVIKEWVGQAAAMHPALPGFYGLKEAEFETPRAYKLYEEASAITYLTKDDPPVWAFYGELGEIPADAKPGAGIHHINFGLRLKEKMDALKIECTIRSREDRGSPDKEMVEFFAKHLG